MPEDAQSVRLTVERFSLELSAMTSEQWASPAPAALLDRYNAILDEARRAFPLVSLWPRRLEPTNEASILDVMMYVEHISDRCAEADPSGDSGIWKILQAP
jgi:hypothetical protein